MNEYGIKSAQIRIGHESKKGYLRSQFDDAFGRYLSFSAVTPHSSETSKQLNTGAAFGVSFGPKRFAPGNPSETLEPLPDKACFDVSDKNGGAGKKEKNEVGNEREEEL